MTSPKSEQFPQGIYYALQHPLRRDILLTLGSKKPLAPSDYAESRAALEEVDARQMVSLVAYHFRVLTRAGVIEVVKEEKVRGSVKSLFRPTAKFTAEIRDCLALDRIAELLLGQGNGSDAALGIVSEIGRIVAISGRPVPDDKGDE